MSEAVFVQGLTKAYNGRTIVDYLKFARDFNRRFPGFETDVHGLIRITENGEDAYFVDCVKTEFVPDSF